MKEVLNLSRYCASGPVATEGEAVVVPIRLLKYSGKVRMHRAKGKKPGVISVESSSAPFALIVLNTLRKMLEAQGVQVHSDVLAPLSHDYTLDQLKEEK